MFIVFSGALLLADEALTPVQMLWVNLIMDTLAALALATEPPGDELLLRKPHSRNDKIINSTMWRNIIGHAFYQITVLMVILFKGVEIFNLQQYDKDEPFFVLKTWAEDNANSENPVLFELANQAITTDTYDWPTAKCKLYTMVFQSFVMMQIFNLINARKLGDRDFNVFHGFFNNFRFLLIFLSIFGAQILICQNGGMVARTAGLNLNQHYICAGIGAFSLVWSVVIKLLMPSRFFDCLAINEEEMPEKDAEASFVTSIRKSFRQSIKRGLEEQKSHNQLQGS
jgi:Ca2+ transporting ATPase